MFFKTSKKKIKQKISIFEKNSTFLKTKNVRVNLLRKGKPLSIHVIQMKTLMPTNEPTDVPLTIYFPSSFKPLLLHFPFLRQIFKTNQIMITRNITNTRTRKYIAIKN